MDWIKKHFDQFVLALLGAVLIAASVMIFLNTSGFEERFEAAMRTPARNDQIPKMDTVVIDEARRQLEQPTIWKARSAKTDPNAGVLFSARRYIVDPSTGKLKPVEDASTWAHSRTKEPIPNEWVLANNFNALDPVGATQDADGDGFLNEDEWLHKTNPNQKADHPPYVSQLFLKKHVTIPFRFTFRSYNGDVKNPASLDFQIETLDLSERTRFVRLGEMVGGTPFKLASFAFKERENEKTGAKDDISELTMINVETQDSIVLVLNREAKSANEFATFSYHLVAAGVSDAQKPFEFTVAKGKEFVLKPETDKRYKLIDVKAAEAVIQLPDGQKYTVPNNPGGPPK